MTQPASYEGDFIHRVGESLTKVKDDPRAVVLVASGACELMTSALIEHRCKNGKQIIKENARDFPFSIRLILLHELSILDDMLFRRLNRLRKVRNRAAHDALFEPSDDEVTGMLEGALLLPKKDGRLAVAVGRVMDDLWAVDSRLFVRLFAPARYADLLRLEATASDTPECNPPPRENRNGDMGAQGPPAQE